VRPEPLLAFAAIAIPTPALAQRSCESLKDLALPQAAVTAATPVAAASFTIPNAPSAKPLALPAYCRVEGVARPTADSEIKFEVWLPVGAAWNGKFNQIGNGGYAGVITPAGLASGAARGFATAATDNGHVGPTPEFAIGHPEKVIDFGHRAVHLTAEHGKAIVAAFYGRPAARSYFFGCSDGGREALMEAKRYPADFYGIIVGAPANDWTRLLTSGVSIWLALNETPGSMIPVDKLAAIQRAALEQCDRGDGVADGLIEDPRRCQFRPATLQCRGAEDQSCLTADQLRALEKIYRGPSRAGEPLFPGMVPGTEAYPGNWNPWMVGLSPTGLPLLPWFGTTFYANMVFENPGWDFKTFDLDRDFATALAKVAPHLDATDPDLTAFRDRGGKLIQYHGWGDAAINGHSSIEYYQRVKRTMEKPGAPPVEDFYRLFMVPGMGHCAGGAGPSSFGNGFDNEHQGDPSRDLRTALERWVEQGTAPEMFIATGVRSGDPVGDRAKETPLSRPLCRYPKVARYRGQGSTDEATSFACAEPK
jgi:feruloyl esterase